MKRTFLLMLTFSALLAQAATARMVVVIHPQTNVKLSAEEVAKIFLGKVRSFPDGTLVKPVDQAEGTPARSEFITSILRKTEPALKTYWSTLVFTGNGTPPDTVADDEAVKKFIKANPNAIGYIDSGSVDDSVKVVNP